MIDIFLGNTKNADRNTAKGPKDNGRKTASEYQSRLVRMKISDAPSF